jgi:hypothetical protein
MMCPADGIKAVAVHNRAFQSRPYRDRIVAIIRVIARLDRATQYSRAVSD